MPIWEGHYWIAHWHREQTTGCYTVALRDVAKLRMTPGVEALAVAHLDDPDPQVVINAAETLGRYGSPASAQALRAQFDRWHRAWEGRQDELGYSRTAGSAERNARDGRASRFFKRSGGDRDG